MIDKKEEYTERFIESCFQFWYSAGCPNFRKLHDLMIEKEFKDEYGRIPYYDILRIWSSERDWSFRREGLDEKAAEKMDVVLVDQTVEMWKAHAEAAREVALKALAHVREHGFDTSASAVAAIRWAQEEERKTRGAEAFITTLKNADNQDIVEMVRELMERSSATDDVVDGEASEEK